MSTWIEKYINKNQYSRPAEKLNDVRKLVIHYTANNGGTAMNHFNYFNNLRDRYASAHIFVDKNEAINIIPLNEIAYHANDVQKRNADGSAWRGVKELLPNANYLSVGVEMCLEKDGTFHADTVERTVDVFVDLCKKFKLDPLKDIVRHFDHTAKNCPAPWVTDFKQFVDFKKRVDAKLNPSKEDNKLVTPPSSDTYIVQKNDTLWGIATANKMTVDELKKLNNLTSDTINIGDKLNLKKVAATTQSTKPVEQPKPVASEIKSIGKIQIVNVNNAAFVMDNPDRNSAKVLGTIQKGDKIDISGSVKGKNNPDGYWEVIYKSKRSYISGQFGKRV
ncbi:N-acetylmuramoyl-L-alanine amidase [Bacillus xiapuensis]|uniref:N-acetylmuramoyl-L-alanine amidase n=1 Tax=Bacillus xiapuensis TaxID=2014075 RepID=A0ABU6NAE3_9BACI|nr:N-acetylmuramoyl-L-alanine amidase [Bacillus xiapuensis]